MRVLLALAGATIALALTAEAATPAVGRCVRADLAPQLMEIAHSPAFKTILPAGWSLEAMRTQDSAVTLVFHTPRPAEVSVALATGDVASATGQGKLFRFLIQGTPTEDESQILLRAAASFDAALPADAVVRCEVGLGLKPTPAVDTSAHWRGVALALLAVGVVALLLRRRSIRWRLVLTRLALSLAAFALGLGGLEVAFRRAPPPPPTQFIRNHVNAVTDVSRSPRLRVENGVPVWGSPERTNLDCVRKYPERTQLVFFGDSITHGSTMVSDGVVFTQRLQERLNARQPSPGFCVLNFAQPGFGFEQSEAVAQAELPRLHPTLVFWQFWANWRHYELIGDTAYEVHAYALRDGVPCPKALRWVPSAWHAWLFQHSRVYEYTALRFGERNDRPYAEERTLAAQDDVARANRVVKKAGASLEVLIGAWLDKPFVPFAPDRRMEEEGLTAVRDAALAQGVPVMPFQDALLGQDYLALRADPCCHFNEAGHQRVAEKLEAEVLQRLAAP
jgi:lysophospholipase L1-like esterase